MRRLFVLWLIGLFLLPSGIAIAQSDSDEDLVSPATGQAAVVAQGVTPLPAERMRWTVQTAKGDPSQDPLAVAGPGFVTADRGAVLVTFANDERNFLGKGESVFVPADGAEVTVVGEEPTTVKVIALQDSSTSTEDAIFSGVPFAALEGDRDINLVRAVLKIDEMTAIVNGDSPAAILVLKGVVTVKNADGGTIELSAGNASQLTGDLVATNTGTNTATVLIAVIGSEIEDADTIEPQATTAPTATTSAAQEPGSITYTTYLCPDDVTVSQASPDTCQSSLEFGPGYYSLTGGSLSGVVDPVSVNGEWGWRDLSVGTYAVHLVRFPDGFDAMAIDLVSGVSRSGNTITVSLGNGANTAINVYFFLPDSGGTATGTAFIGISLYDCPVGSSTDPDELDASVCSDANGLETYTLTLTEPALGVNLTADDLIRVEPQPSMDGDYRWNDLAAGTYTVTAITDSGEDAFVMLHACGDPSGCNPVTQFDPQSGTFDLADGQTFLLVIYHIPTE